jgi:hypothetical protein
VHWYGCAVHGQADPCDAGNFDAKLLHLGFGQVLDLGIALDTRGNADLLRASAANAVNRLKRDLRVLVVGNVYPCNPGHPVTPSKVATPLRRKAENYTSKQ